MNKLFFKAMRDRRGATAIEYGLILALLVVAMMAGIQFLGIGTSGLWQGSLDRITAAIG